MKVSVCVNTYKREHIFHTLLSVFQQKLPPDVEVELIVSDNDADGEGCAHVERFVQKTGFPVNYKIVPEKNIAVARNSAVERATGDWVLFVDDDEWAEQDWVATLLEYASKYSADLVQGYAISRFEKGAAEWIAKADPLSKRWGPAGKQLRFASTCNLLVRASLLKATPTPFNPRFGKMGNDDAEMSYRLFKAGAKIVVCDHAPVYEVVPADRSSVAYLKARNRGFGQAYMYLIKPELSRLRRLKVFSTAVGKAVVYLVISELARLKGKDLWLKYRIKFWIDLGKLDYFLGLKKIENY
jgi:succinoglycan biosynthesis protein ExoM